MLFSDIHESIIIRVYTDNNTMSLSEYSTILKEMNGGGGTTSDTINVQHHCILSLENGILNEQKVEQFVHHTAQSILSLGKHVVVSIRMVSIAISISLLCWGASRLMTSLSSSTQRPHDNKRDNNDPTNSQFT